MRQVLLPWRGEFGQMLMTHVRFAAAMQWGIVVCCKPGDEPLFPRATEFFYDWVMPEDSKRNTKFLSSRENMEYQDALKVRLAVKYPDAEFWHPLQGAKPQHCRFSRNHDFVPQPRCPAPMFFPEVLVAPRWRRHGEHRNFQYWPDVVSRLIHAGVTVGLIGTQESSVPCPQVSDQLRAWSYPQNLGTTLHWMQRCKLVLTTDSGMAHLAVLARAPLKVIYGEPGVETGSPKGWKWVLPQMQEHAYNHCEPILHGWDDPQRVYTEALHYFAGSPLPAQDQA